MNTPLPSGAQIDLFQSRWEQSSLSGFFAPDTAKMLYGVAEGIAVFLQTFWWLVIPIGCALVVLGVLIWWIGKKQRTLEILQIYFAFFLTKRLMIVPTLLTLSRQDQNIDAHTYKQILAFRRLAMDTSLIRESRKRMTAEAELSVELFRFCEQLEKNLPPRTNPLISDLEFIDQKLVALHQNYNQAARAWDNLRAKFPPLRLITRRFVLLEFPS